MKRVIAVIVILSIMVFMAGCSGKDKPVNSNTGGINTTKLTEDAVKFIEDLKNGNYKEAAANFDSTMKAQLPEGKLGEIWKSLGVQCGDFKEQLGTRSEKAGEYDVIYVTLAFNKMNLDAKVVFNKSGQISGLFFLPSKQTDNKAVKVTDKAPSEITESEVTVGDKEWALPGTLSMPRGDGPFPVVILVHGSGPNDRDETIGQNKPFRDIAWGLAERGIAVLRYDKRTKVYADKLKALAGGVTVREETMEDAAAAVSLMLKTKGIGKNRIFVLGHSLGGMLIPRIAKLTPKAAGYIVMAGSVRPLEDLILEQTNYILSLDKTTAQSKKDEALKQTQDAVNNIKRLKNGDKTPADKLFGVPASYWLDLKGYNPAKTAKAIKKPMLIMQGERDYQVTLKDFGLWKSELSGNKNVSFKSYKDLNHLFMTGKGKSTPQEYDATGHVSEKAIDDIYNFIKEN